MRKDIKFLKMAVQRLLKFITVKMWSVTAIFERSADSCDRSFIFGGLQPIPKRQTAAMLAWTLSYWVSDAPHTIANRWLETLDKQTSQLVLVDYRSKTEQLRSEGI